MHNYICIAFLNHSCLCLIHLCIRNLLFSFLIPYYANMKLDILWKQPVNDSYANFTFFIVRARPINPTEIENDVCTQKSDIIDGIPRPAPPPPNQKVSESYFDS